MSVDDQNNDLNEFEYSPEELAELAKLDALNDGKEEIEEIDVDSDLLDDLLNPEDPKADPAQQEQIDQEPGDDPAQDQNQPLPVEGDDKPAEEKQPPEVEPVPVVEEIVPIEPAPDYTEQLEEAKSIIEDVQGKIDDAFTQLTELSEKYDNGEIGQGKYDIERLRLEREIRKSERLLEEAETEHKNLKKEAETRLSEYQEQRQSQWQQDIKAFAAHPANTLIVNNPHIAEQFDQILKTMGQSGVFEGLSNEQILISVRNQLSFRVPELNKTPYVKTTTAQAPQTQDKPKKPTHEKANLPPSLSQMQVQELPADDPFAYIRKLSGVKYEEALSKLSEEQYDKFLFG